MRNIIVDIASLGQDALVKALGNKELNILGVTVSPDVENYEDLCNLNIKSHTLFFKASCNSAS